MAVTRQSIKKVLDDMHKGAKIDAEAIGFLIEVFSFDTL